MKKNIHLVLTVLALIVSVAAKAQCTIASTGITGFSPASPDTITQQISYSQTQQLYVDAQYFSATIESITIDSIGGLPAGISYVINPVSGTIAGGADGAICFTGTTTNAAASYPLTFYGTALVNNMGSTSTQPLSDFPILGVADTFVVRAAGSTGPVPHFNVGKACYDSVVYIDQSSYSPTSWSWTFTGGNPSTSTQQNPVVQYSSAGTYSATLVASNQLGSNSITQSVMAVGVPGASVVTTPATGPATANGSAVATATGGTPPYQYNWSNTDTGAGVSGLLPAQYTVTITDANGCISQAATATVTYTTGLVQLTNGQQLKVYPNPATDVLNLVWSQKPNSVISVVDLNGKVISTFTATGGLSNVVDVSSLVAGAYILRVTDIASHQQSATLFSKF